MSEKQLQELVDERVMEWVLSLEEDASRAEPLVRRLVKKHKIKFDPPKPRKAPSRTIGMDEFLPSGILVTASERDCLVKNSFVEEEGTVVHGDQEVSYRWRHTELDCYLVIGGREHKRWFFCPVLERPWVHPSKSRNLLTFLRERADNNKFVSELMKGRDADELTQQE